MEMQTGRGWKERMKRAKGSKEEEDMEEKRDQKKEGEEEIS